jgi:hypothetical protein
MSVLTNALGLLLAVALGAGQHGIEAIIVAFTYYSNATRIMFEFNQIYRQPGELADRSRAVHRVAADAADRGRPDCARAAAAEGERRPLRARDVSRTRAGCRCSPASTSPCRAGPSSAWSAGQAVARPR